MDDSPQQQLGPPLSARPDTSYEMRAALGEIEDFLADRVPPLMVAESVELFMGAPADGAAAEIWGWAGRQQALDPGVLPLVELLFHALHKLSVIGELDLVGRDPLIAYLRSVGERLAEACPTAERERLRRALLHLGESDMVRTDPIEVMRRVSSGFDLPASPAMRRLSLMEQRLREAARSSTPAAQALYRRVASQAITTAANEAKNEGELEEHLRRLKQAGVASAAEEVFRSLGQELAEWALPKELAPDTAAMGDAGEVQAMKQIVSLPQDPIEVARRYRHLVTAATQQFNEGNLGGAVQMFDLAARLAAEKKVAPGYLEPIQKRGHEALDPARLRQYLEKSERHPQLLSILEFFQPGFGVGTLLDDLEGEERRERRRLLLDLLVVHGRPARALAKSRLIESVRTPAPDFARRNWIYLLRLLPRAADEPIEAELEAICRFAGPGGTPFLVREALLYLGQTRHARAAQALLSLLRTWEEHVLGADDDIKGEGLVSLDRLAAALARQASPRTWGALCDHALGRRQGLGATMSRLGELATQDLSSSPEIVERITTEIRDALPRGMLGRLVARRDLDLPTLIGSLAGTRTAEVQELLEELAERFPSNETGRAATRALQTIVAPASAGISGEIDAFGLPVVLQRLMESRATGNLNVMPREGGGAAASVGFLQGRIAYARWGRRQGHDAFYQLFERPVVASYAFDPAVQPAGAVLGELATLVREGVRRARELRRSTAIVPGDAPLAATGTAPGTIEQESEYELIVALWQKTCAGVVPDALEAELAADAFRIYRPLAQWLEEGALQIQIATPPAPEPESAGGTASGGKRPTGRFPATTGEKRPTGRFPATAPGGGTAAAQNDAARDHEPPARD